MFKIAACGLLGLTLGIVAPAQAIITDRTPYYMCFAYTPDGMLFAGGDFNFRGAQKMMAANCSMPKNLSVVLLRTVMVRRNGKLQNYETP